MPFWIQTNLRAFLTSLRLPSMHVVRQEVILVSFSKGKVQSTPGYEVIKQLPSFICLETGI
jgi:hypothetical protein